MMLKYARTGLALLLVFAVVIFANSCGDDDGTGPITTIIDLVVVEDVTATSTGAGVKVDVRFANETPLSALEVPLRVSGSGFNIDSVSFTGSRIGWVDDTISTILQSEKSVILAAIEYDSLITEGEGLLGSIFFTINENARGQVLTIDTTTIDMSPIFHSLVYEDTSATVLELVPAFEPGEISVLF